MSFRFKRREPLGSGFVRIAREELEGALAELASDLGEGIHQARRRLKKLRALLRLMQPWLGEQTFTRDNAAARDAAHALSPARDAAVQLATLDGLIEVCAAREVEKLTPLRRQLAGARTRRPAAAEKPVPMDAVIVRLRKLLAHFGAAPAKPADWTVVRDALDRAYRRARRAYATAQKRLSNKTLHAWRRRVKTLQHELQLVRRAAPQRCARILRRLARLGDCLGSDHDLALLAPVLTSGGVTDKKVLAKLSRQLQTRRGKLQRRAFRLGDEIFAEKPAAWRKPLARALKRWHAPR